MVPPPSKQSTMQDVGQVMAVDLADPAASQVTGPIISTPPVGDFECFKRLPIELRLKIWKLSIPTDRVVAITDRRARFEQNGYFRMHYPLIFARYTVPGCMQVCKEGRNEIKKLYAYILGSLVGLAVPFNFEHDTLLMDGPDGSNTLWTFEKAGRSKTNASAELAVIHSNLKHLVVAGQRLLDRTLNEAHQYTALKTLVLPFNPYWNATEGRNAFNTRIAQRLSLAWTDDTARAAAATSHRLSRVDMGTDAEGRSMLCSTRRRPHKMAAVPDSQFLTPIAGDVTDYTKSTCRTVITFKIEEELRLEMAGRTNVTLSWVKDDTHPALKKLPTYDKDIDEYIGEGGPRMMLVRSASVFRKTQDYAVQSAQRAAYREWFKDLGIPEPSLPRSLDWCRLQVDAQLFADPSLPLPRNPRNNPPRYTDGVNWI